MPKFDKENPWVDTEGLTQEEIYKITVSFLENEIKARDELLAKIERDIKLYLKPQELPIGYNYD
jgi:hypothetical protein